MFPLGMPSVTVYKQPCLCRFHVSLITDCSPSGVVTRVTVFYGKTRLSSAGTISTRSNSFITLSSERSLKAKIECRQSPLALTMMKWFSRYNTPVHSADICLLACRIAVWRRNSRPRPVGSTWVQYGVVKSIQYIASRISKGVLEKPEGRDSGEAVVEGYVLVLNERRADI